MRVLMLGDFYPPDYNGGAEQYIRTLSQELVRHGHQVAVATTQNHPEIPTFEVDEGVRVHRIPGWNRALAPFYKNPDFKFHPALPDPGIMAGLYRIIKEESPEVVHAHTWIVYSFIGLKAWSKAKLVTTLHSYGLVCPTSSYIHDGRVCTGPGVVKCIHCAGSTYGVAQAVAQTSGLKLSSHLHRYVDQFIAVSSAVRDASVQSAGQRPIQVIPALIPDKVVDEGRRITRPSFLPATDDYILFVGRQYDNGHKGFHVLLDAYAGLTDRPPLIAIVAEDEDKTIPQRLPVGVTMARKVAHDQVMAAWAHCAIGVVPSVWPDPCPIVTLEAMASGKPVVASAIGGLTEEVVDGETGILVPPANAAALRDALGVLLTDPRRRARLGAAARERARQFMASTITDRIEQIYVQLLGVPHSASMPG